METLITLIGLSILFYFIKKDKRKQDEYNEKHKDIDNKEWVYDPETKRFIEKQKTIKADQDPVYSEIAQTNENPEIGNYYAKPLLTAHEMQAYTKLKPEADSREFLICPKVRLADLVHPYNNDPNYMSHFGRIKAKHVDFVICDQLMNVKGIIELDDRSHNRKDRQERDQLVDDILTSVGYKIIHTKDITPNILDNFIKE